MHFTALKAALTKLPVEKPEDARLRDLFVARLQAWETDSSTAHQLLDDLRGLLGSSRFSDAGAHQRVFDAIEAFGTNVHYLSGMTMNERLFVFGFLDQWDDSPKATRQAIRLKLEASLHSRRPSAMLPRTSKR